jgi:hypothetical protein
MKCQYLVCTQCFLVGVDNGNKWQLVHLMHHQLFVLIALRSLSPRFAAFRSNSPCDVGVLRNDVSILGLYPMLFSWHLIKHQAIGHRISFLVLHFIFNCTKIWLILVSALFSYFAIVLTLS